MYKDINEALGLGHEEEKEQEDNNEPSIQGNLRLRN